MKMHKNLQKVLAVALMTSFFSTSFIMGVSEAAPGRHFGGQRPAQTQQVRPVSRSAGHQARPAVYQGTYRQQSRPMQRSRYGHQGPIMHRRGSTHHGPAVHKDHPMMHKGGSIHHGGPVIHRNGPSRRSQSTAHRGDTIYREGPVIHRNGPIHRSEPMARRDDTIYRGDPVVVTQQRYPAPPPPSYPYPYYRDDHRSLHSGDWIGALIIGGILGAIIANSGHRHTDKAPIPVSVY